MELYCSLGRCVVQAGGEKTQAWGSQSLSLGAAADHNVYRWSRNNHGVQRQQRQLQLQLLQNAVTAVG